MASPDKDYKQLYHEALAEVDSLKNQLGANVAPAKNEEAAFREFVEGCQLPFLLLKTEIICECNVGAVQFFGKKKKEQLFSKSFFDLSPEFQLDDVPSAEKWELLKKAIEKEGSYQFLWGFSSRDDVVQCRLYITTMMRDGMLYHIVTILDISEELRHEDEIRQLSLVSNYTGSSVVITDAFSRIIWVNQSFTKLTGYLMDEVQGRVPGHFLQGPLSDQDVVSIMRRSISLQKPFQVELINYKKSGEPYWVDINVNPVFSKKGKLERYIGLSTDITERKKTEIALVKSEELHRSILTIAQEAIVLVNKEGVTTYANPHYSKLMGLPLDKIVGVPLVDSLHPKMKEFWLQKFKERKKGQVGNYDKLLTTYDKGDIWVHITGTAVKDDKGEFNGSLIMMYDISDRKRSENRLRQRDVFLTALTESQRILMDVKSTVKDSIYCVLEKLSKAMEVNLMRLIRWGSSEVSLLGEYSNVSITGNADEWDNGLYMNHSSDFYKRITRRECMELDTLELLEYREFVGSIMHSANYLVVPMYKGAEMLGFLLVGRKGREKWWTKAEKALLQSTSVAFSMALEYWDVLDSLSQSRDQLKDSNERLAQEVQRADDANAAKGRFLANISHEIRTPLNGILGYAQLMERSVGLSEEDSRRIRIIRSSGVHLLTLINDILDLSKVESGKMPVEKDWFGLRHFMDEIISILKVKADEKRILLDWSVQGFQSLPLQVFSDIRLLRQVLLNLIGNAIKYTQEGYVKVCLKVLEKNDEKVLLRFEIIDSGIGIEEAHLKKLFNEFFQVASAQKTTETGTGLGLSLSARMVKLLGGRIQVTSKPGNGSCFSFALIMQYKSDEKEIQDEIRLIRGYDGDRKNVLVVDDIEDNRVILKEMLQEVGFNVSSASDGDEALMLCQKMVPDMIFCDLVMPNISGFDFAKLISNKEYLKDVPIVAVSASVSNDYYTLESLDAFDDFIPKPVEWYALCEVLKEFLDLSWVFEAEVSDQAIVVDDSGETESIGGQVSPHMLARIRSAAEMGDMSAVSALADMLVEGVDENQILSEALKKYAGNFDEDAIVSLVEGLEVEDE